MTREERIIAFFNDLIGKKCVKITNCEPGEITGTMELDASVSDHEKLREFGDRQLTGYCAEQTCLLLMGCVERTDIVTKAVERLSTGDYEALWREITCIYHDPCGIVLRRPLGVFEAKLHEGEWQATASVIGDYPEDGCIIVFSLPRYPTRKRTLWEKLTKAPVKPAKREDFPSFPGPKIIRGTFTNLSAGTDRLTILRRDGLSDQMLARTLAEAFGKLTPPKSYKQELTI